MAVTEQVDTVQAKPVSTERIAPAEAEVSGVTREEILEGIAQKFFDRGYALHEKGDFAGSIGAYRKALEFDPSDTLTVHNLGVSVLAYGKELQSSLDAAEKIRAVDELWRYAKEQGGGEGAKDLVTSLSMALAKAMGNAYGAEKAIEEAAKREALPPKIADHMRGLLNLELGNQQCRSMRSAEKENRDDAARAHAERAVVCLKTASELLASRLDAANTERLRFNLGMAYLGAKQPTQAVPIFEGLASQGSTEAIKNSATINQVIALLEAETYREAFRVCGQSIGSNPGSKNAAVLFRLAEKALDKLEGAEDHSMLLDRWVELGKKVADKAPAAGN